MNRSLLIVDDDPDQLDILARWFVRAGYHVVSVHHPRQALAAVAFQPFQVALLAANLPEMDTMDLVHCLRRFQDRLECMILTGRRPPQRRVASQPTTARLVNPRNIPLLQAAVEDAFERAMQDMMYAEVRS